MVEQVSRQTENLGIPWRSPMLIVILAVTLMTPLDVPLISPVLPAIAAKFGVTESTAGLFVTLYALPGILLAPVIGSLADRFGRRYVLAGCLTVFGVTGTAIAFTSDFTIALGLRLAQGFAAGSLLSALAMTMVGDRYTGRQHDGVMGITSAMLSLGTAVYPIIGGYLAGRAWNAPFLMYAIPIPVAVMVLFGLDDRETTTATSGRAYIREAIRVIPTGRAVALYGVMFASFGLMFGGLYTALPFHLSRTFGLSSTTVGAITSGVLVVTALVSTQNGRIAADISIRSTLSIGFGLYASGFVIVALADGLWLLASGLLLIGVGSGLVTPTLFTGLSTLAPDHLRGGVMSLQTTTIGLSQAAGPVAFTLMAASLGYQQTFLAASGVATIGIAVIAVAGGSCFS